MSFCEMVLVLLIDNTIKRIDKAVMSVKKVTEQQQSLIVVGGAA